MTDIKVSFKKLLVIAHLTLSTFIILRFTKQTYGVNDDVIIRSWLSGEYTGTPEYMIRGSATPKIIFGIAISNLYKIYENINWYSMAVLAGTLISWLLIGLIVIESNKILVYLFYFLISTIHLIWFLPSPTYTASAVLLTTSTLIYFIKKINGSFLLILMVSSLFSFAYLMRPESFYFSVFVLLPALFLVKKQPKKTLVGLGIFFSTIFLVIGVDSVIEKRFYANNEDWKIYKELEQNRYLIQANLPEKQLLSNPKKFGWTEAESKLFESYITIDSQFFNAAKYKSVIDNTKKLDFNNPVALFVKGHKQIINSDINWEWFKLASLIPLSFMIFLLSSLPDVKKFFLLSIFSLSLLYFIMQYVALFLRQPERVQVSAIFLAIIVPFVYFLLLENRDLRRKDLTLHFNNTIVAYLCLIIAFFKVFDQAQYLDKKYSGANNVFWIKQIQFLSNFPNNSIFIGNASMFRNNWISPYSVSKSEVEGRIFTLGWHNYSPHWIKRSDNLGLNPNKLLNDAIEKPNVFWVSDASTLEYLVKFMTEKKYIFKNPILIANIDFVGNDYSVWKFTK